MLYVPGLDRNTLLASKNTILRNYLHTCFKLFLPICVIILSNVWVLYANKKKTGFYIHWRIRQPQAPTRGGSRARKPTLIDAFTYMDGVKETFRETPYKYQMFLDVLKDYGVR